MEAIKKCYEILNIVQKGADTQKEYFCPGTRIWIRKSLNNLIGQIC